MNQRHGFTFIEVLVAMLIFTMAAVTAIELVKGSVMATRDTKAISEATWLLQNLMTELETKINTIGFQDGCEKKTEARFDAPYDNYAWVAYCDEIDFQLSQTAAQMMAQGNDSEDAPRTATEDPVLNTILNLANGYISSAVRELHAEVYWQSGANERKVTVTTHVVRLDQPLAIGGVTGGSSGGSGSDKKDSDSGGDGSS